MRWFGWVQHLPGRHHALPGPLIQGPALGACCSLPPAPSSYSHCWHRVFALGKSLNVHNIYLVFLSFFGVQLFFNSKNHRVT